MWTWNGIQSGTRLLLAFRSSPSVYYLETFSQWIRQMMIRALHFMQYFTEFILTRMWFSMLQLDSANNNCEQLQNALAHQKEATASAKATAAEHVSSLAKKYAFLSKFLKQWGKENIRVGESAEFTIQSSHTLDASHEGESDSEWCGHLV